MKTRTLLLIALIPLFSSLQACGSWWLPRPHKIDIQQGNLLSPEAIAQVTVGMNKSQVVSLIGNPLTSNKINPNRWEYIYSTNRSGERPNVKRLSLVFQNEVVADLERDGLPAVPAADSQ